MVISLERTGKHLIQTKTSSSEYLQQYANYRYLLFKSKPQQAVSVRPSFEPFSIPCILDWEPWFPRPCRRNNTCLEIVTWNGVCGEVRDFLFSGASSVSIASHSQTLNNLKALRYLLYWSEVWIGEPLSQTFNEFCLHLIPCLKRDSNLIEARLK